MKELTTREIKAVKRVTELLTYPKLLNELSEELKTGVDFERVRGRASFYKDLENRSQENVGTNKKN